MAIMKCPKCGGCGEIIVDPGKEQTAAPYKTTCPSCGGKGYVTDQAKEVSNG